jgi:hypothetical protein
MAPPNRLQTRRRIPTFGKNAQAKLGFVFLTSWRDAVGRLFMPDEKEDLEGNA